MRAFIDHEPPSGDTMRARFGTACWLAVACWGTPALAQTAAEVHGALTGAWLARKAERDGKNARDVVGNRLSFFGRTFEIRSKDGKTLFAGTYDLNPGAKPASIDFTHKQGKLKGKAWKGIYALEGGTLTVCDNAVNMKKDRPKAFETKAGSGIVCIDFQRATK
jgi:uncharacterized protein (TIGR03067 family)